MRAYAIPAHLFLTTGVVGGQNRWAGQPAHAPAFEMLDWGEIEALHEAGVNIECHTHQHPDMRRLTEAAVHEECDGADGLIARRLGRRPRFFAYPYGYHNQRVRDYVRNRYRAGVTTALRTLRAAEDPAALPRLDSYYLRAWMARDFEGPRARSYLWLRGLVRRLRGKE
jgi:peptidoglycan/xylan/chitin deacetylase (PgdA/CDA1 family)